MLFCVGLQPSGPWCEGPLEVQQKALAKTSPVLEPVEYSFVFTEFQPVS
jgi:hypothetical protein